MQNNPSEIQTPLLLSHVLSKLTHKTIYLKCEALQPSGSFKDRGLGKLCDYYAARGVKGFVCSSGGNAGMAVAYASKRLGLPATIVIPMTTPQIMVDKLQAEGVEVVMTGKNWNEADAIAQKLVESQQMAYIPPFDHPIIWEGHASLVRELHQSGVKPDAIIVAVGGGGLLCGIAEGLHSVGWHDVSIITAETEGAASLAASVKAKKRVTLATIDTIAVTLGAKQVCQKAYEWTSQHPIFPETVTDKAAVSACWRFADDHRMLVEPACGAALAIVYDQPKILERFNTVVVIVCGGSGVSLELLNEWKKQFL